jgi:hypothetical protein
MLNQVHTNENLIKRKVELEEELKIILEQEEILKKKYPYLYSLEEQIKLRGGLGFVSVLFTLFFILATIYFYFYIIEEKKADGIFLKSLSLLGSVFIGSGLAVMLLSILTPALRFLYRIAYKLPKEEVTVFVKNRKTQHYKKIVIIKEINYIKRKLGQS